RLSAGVDGSLATQTGGRPGESDQASVRARRRLPLQAELISSLFSVRLNASDEALLYVTHRQLLCGVYEASRKLAALDPWRPPVSRQSDTGGQTRGERRVPRDVQSRPAVHDVWTLPGRSHSGP